MTDASTPSRRGRCPRCGMRLGDSPEPKLPFCSERCKLLDLGAWATGRYVITGKPTEDAVEAPNQEDEGELH